jgi:hypothetical protein
MPPTVWQVDREIHVTAKHIGTVSVALLRSGKTSIIAYKFHDHIP